VNNVVSEAAASFAALVLEKSGGSMPPIGEPYRMDWYALALHVGVIPVPIEDCPRNFTARLEYDAKRDLWLLVYNRNRSAREKARYYCHEMGEFLCLADMPDLHDYLNGRVFNYTGEPDPKEVHHRVGCEVERRLMATTSECDDTPDTPAQRMAGPESSSENLRIEELTLKITLFREQIGLCHRQIESLDKQIASLDKT
jgi:hypothetical protein